MSANKTGKSYRKWIIVLIAVAVAAVIGYKYWQSKQSELPPGIASGNGRLEAKLVDVSAKEALRVKEVLVDEGDLVQPGQLVARLDTVTLEAELAEADAAVAAAQEKLAVAAANIRQKQSEIELARIEVKRSQNLVEANAGSQRELDVRRAMLATTQAGLSGEQAQLQAAHQEVKVARANGAAIQTRIDDAVLVSPILGRVLYRLTEPGEVLAPGGKALTLVNLEDVYMEIFLPSAQAAALKVGSEGRITVDSQPGRAAVGYVTFVSPEAQFTPKEVETQSEREKLMFRVKIQVPKELVSNYIQSIKTGVRGVGYVKVTESAVWPPSLQANLLTVDKASPLTDGSPSGTADRER